MTNPIWIGSPNYWDGRKGNDVMAIVFHVEEGSEEGTETWFQNPASQVSAHYSVARDGKVHQYVKEIDSAWANGKVNDPTWKYYEATTNPNRTTISIEHEGMHDGSFTEEQIQSTIELAADIAFRNNIPVEEDTVTDHHRLIGHYQLDNVRKAQCPGPNFPWSRVIQEVQAKVAELKNPVTVEAPVKKLDWEGHWAAADIKRLLDAGVLSGIDDAGNFAPDSMLTRGQMAHVACAIFDHIEKTHIASQQDQIERLKGQVTGLQTTVGNLTDDMEKFKQFIQTHAPVGQKI